MTTTERGIQMNPSDEQTMKACDSIRDNFEPRSKVTDERFWHDEKQRLPMVVTHEGMHIDFSNEPESADASRTETVEPLSNARSVRSKHPFRKRPPTVVIENGTQIEHNDRQAGS
jgi:hypothetical protein